MIATGIAGRVAVVAGWVAALAALTTWSDTTGALSAGAVVTFFAGALVRTPWVLTVPLLPGTILALGAAIAAEPDSDGVTGLQWALFIEAVAVLLAGLLAGGVVVGRLYLRHRARSRR